MGTLTDSIVDSMLKKPKKNYGHDSYAEENKVEKESTNEGY